MSSGDRRRLQTALHTVATPPAPLLLLPASQSLTFNADDVHLPGLLMPMPQAAADAQIAVGNKRCVSLSQLLIGHAPNVLNNLKVWIWIWISK